MNEFNGLKKTVKRKHHGKENAEPDPFNNSLLENILGDNINDIVGRRSDIGKRSLRVDADESIEDVEINDDALEKEERRRRTEEEKKKEEIKRAETSRQPTLSLINSLTQAELDQHYSKCIEMCNKNKVNVKNAFKLQLIDYMKLIVSNQSTKSENLTLMSCTLGASAKIYAHRVDKVYSDMVKIVSGKGEIEKEEESEEENGGKEDHEPVRNKRKRTNHVESDEEGDDSAKQIDMEKMLVGEAEEEKWKGEMEAIEKGALKQSEEYFVECRQLEPDGRFSLLPPVFSSRTFTISNILVFSFHENYYDGDYAELDTDGYIRNYNEIEKEYFIFGEEEEISENTAMLNSSLAFDSSSNTENVENLRQNPEDGMDMGDKDEGEEWIGDYDEDIDSDKENKSNEKFGEVSKKKIQSFNAPALARFVSPLAGDYFFFDKERIDFWAGPRHWTIRKPKGEKTDKSSCEQVRRTVKKNLNVEFTEERIKEIKKFYSDSVSAVLTRKTMMTWSARKCKVPQDVSYTQKMLLSVMKNEKLLYVRNDSSNLMIGVGDFNSHDNTLLTPDDFGGDAETGDEDGECCGEEENWLRLEEERAPSPPDLSIDGDLSSPDPVSHLLPLPRKVENISLKFAKAQKKIDIKLLKNKIWESLALQPKSDVKVKFSSVYESLGSKLPKEEAAELSFPIAFMALLHMANERCLHLSGNQDYSDVTVTQS